MSRAEQSIDVYDPTAEFCGCEHKKQAITDTFGPE